VLGLALVPPFLSTLAAQKATIAASQASLDEAEAHARRAIGWTPRDAALYKMLGQIYAREALFRDPPTVYVEKALAAYAESARRNPHDPYTFVLTGWAHLYGGDAPAAETAFLRAASLDPNNPYIRYSLGTAYLWQKKLAPARAELEFAKRYYPNMPELQAALQEIDRLTAAP
jgi:Flp pilus assembly protein TadD